MTTDRRSFLRLMGVGGVGASLAACGTQPTGSGSTGPSSAGMVSQASADTSSVLGTERRMIRRPTGTIMAPPSPCSARAAISQPSDWAKPQAMEPSMNTTIAARNTCFAPKRSAHQPLIGMKTIRLRR